MTNTTQPPAGDVEAREAAVSTALDTMGPTTRRYCSEWLAPAINAAIDAYLAKLTPTKAEPGRIAEIRERKPFKLLVSKEWLMKAISSDPDDESCEAGVLHPEAPRFSIDHGVIHDRNTGKHVRTCNCLHPLEDGVDAALALLNELDRDARLAPYLETALSHITAIEADRDRMREALENILRCDDEAREAAGIEGATLNGYGLVDLFDVLDHPFGSGAHKQSAYRSNDLNNALSNARAALKSSKPGEG